MSLRLLPVDEHVQLQLVLEPDDVGDLGPHALGVAGLVQLPRRRAPALRTSPVWGNEPMVVVGSGGRPSRARWAFSRTS